MSKRLILECDCCGKETAFSTISVFVKRGGVAAGSGDDEYEGFDLCGLCCHKVLNHLVECEFVGHQGFKQAVNCHK